jgi:hypothetical protein
MPNPRTPGREEWRKIQALGMQRFVLTGAVRRAIPMALFALVLLELLEGGSFDRARLASAAFLERVLFVLVVFLIGGAISSYARWRTYQSLYGDGST